MLYIKETEKGKSVFTSETIESGACILIFSGPVKHRKDMTDYEMWIQIGKDLWMGPSGGPDDFVNHSCEPNAGLVEKNSNLVLVAIKHIEQNEEITFDYSTSMFEEPTAMKCTCGAKTCRGIVYNFLELPTTLQEKYINLGIVPEHVK